MVTPQGGPVITDPTDTTTDPEEDGLLDSEVDISNLQPGKVASSTVDTLSKMFSFASWTQDPNQNQSSHNDIQHITSRQSSIGSKNHNPNQNQSHHNDAQPITPQQSSIGSNTQDPNQSKTYENNQPITLGQSSIGSNTQDPNRSETYENNQPITPGQFSIGSNTQDPNQNKTYENNQPITFRQPSIGNNTQDPNKDETYHENNPPLPTRQLSVGSKTQNPNQERSANNTKDVTFSTMLRLQIQALFVKKSQSMIRSWTSSLTPILFFFLSVLLSKYFTTQTYAKPEDSWKITFDDYMPYDPIVVVGAHGQQSEKVQEIYKNMMESYEAEVEEVFIRYLVSFEICMYCVLNAYTITIAKFAGFFY